MRMSKDDQENNPKTPYTHIHTLKTMSQKEKNSYNQKWNWRKRDISKNNTRKR